MASMIYDLPGYIYILLFGEYVSIRLACGVMTRKAWRVFYGICPLLLLGQGLLLQTAGVDAVRYFYPVIAHVPTVLALSLLLRAKWLIAIVSMIISYSMCQLLRWMGLLCGMMAPSPLIAVITHLLLGHGILMLLNRVCLTSLHHILCESPRLILWIGSLPILYYVYDYFLLYTRLRYAHLPVFSELLPTAMVMFYILFACIYQREAKEHRQAKAQNAMLEAELTQAGSEIAALRMVQEQTSVYRHDLRHHLRLIGSLLGAGKTAEAQSYISGAESEIEAIVPAQYCLHDTVNLLLGAFVSKAKKEGVSLRINAAIPQSLNIPDTELCVLLSNGMENAIHAAAQMPEGKERNVDFFCGIRQNNLLIEIQNPYSGEIKIEEGLPLSAQLGHGFGCRSIAFIVQRRAGVCSFDAADGVFSLRIAIPLHRQ